MRFYRWEDWRKIVDAAALTGKEWFALIPRHSFDMAQHLRDRWGWGVADLERSPLCPLPDGIAKVLPTNMLRHPALALPDLFDGH